VRLRRAIVGCIAVGLALAIHVTGVLAGVEDATVDQRFQLRPASTPSDVVLVALDERSLDLLGERPPIPRSLHAAMLDRLRSFHPLVIAYDVQFTEETVDAEDEALYDAVSRTGPLVLGTADVEVDGNTRVLGSTQNVEDAGASVGVTLFPLARGGVYRRVEPHVNGVESLAFAAARAAGHPRTDVGGRGLLIDYA
jgi:CHASE2 domain-containing sensor protein